MKRWSVCATALALTACATRPDGGSTFLDNLFGAAGPAAAGPTYAASPPQGNSTYTCFTQPAPYGGGGTTTCLPRSSTAAPSSGSAPSVTCFTQQAPNGGGATTTCLPR
jgi:hypothetical protein